MNFSLEELFAMYGQYDKFVTLEFIYGSEEYEKFGIRLMGTFIFDFEDRKVLEKTISKEVVERTDRKVKFSPSELEKLSTEQKMDLDKNGIMASSIHTVWSSDLPVKNRFRETGKKEIQNVLNIKAPEFSGWRELNRVRFGFLNSRLKSGQQLAPLEFVQYWAFRKHFNADFKEDEYKEVVGRFGNAFQNKVRLEELRLKYQELIITDEELEEFVKIVIQEIQEKNKIIQQEITFSSEKIQDVVNNYHIELENLRKICLSFDEEIIAFGNPLIYLEFDRFVHIYARHVAETQIGERFAENKTVFQYKFEDIKRIIKMVIESVHDEIQEHFTNTPDKPYRRMGTRSIYYDGHYYRVEIEPNGRLKDFHPYNDDQNTANVL